MQRKGFRLLAAVIVIVFATLMFSACGESNRNKYTVTVTDKQVKRQSKSSDKYLVFTKLENGEVRVFENTDNPFLGKWNSSDVFAQIEIGKKYVFDVAGYRNQQMSWYENIISVMPAEQ